MSTRCGVCSPPGARARRSEAPRSTAVSCTSSGRAPTRPGPSAAQCCLATIARSIRSGAWRLPAACRGPTAVSLQHVRMAWAVSGCGACCVEGAACCSMASSSLMVLKQRSHRRHQLVPRLLRLQRRRRMDGVPSPEGTRHARRQCGSAAPSEWEHAHGWCACPGCAGHDSCRQAERHREPRARKSPIATYERFVPVSSAPLAGYPPRATTR